MEFSIKSQAPEKRAAARQAGCIALGVFESRKLPPHAASLGKATVAWLEAVLASGDMDGKSGTTLLLHTPPGLASERLLLVGLGKEKDFDGKAYAGALRAGVKALLASGAADATLLLTQLPVKKRSTAWRFRQAVLVASEVAYRFDRFKSKKEAPRPLQHLVLTTAEGTGASPAQEGLQQGLAIAEGIALAKTLGNLPGNVCTPGHLADTALQLAAEHGLDVSVLERPEMEALGMHSLLSVAKGSRQPPKLIVAHYRGGKTNAAPIVLVGKGVTFDSGGISLKPGEGMDEMKFDMCGAASVLGALKAAAILRLPLNLTIIVPSVENMPGGAAVKPGDIVSSLSGQSIEILNTDAEGRLILCDALTYAERFKPRAVVDVATLTGACVIALGHVASGLFANDEALAEQLLAAGDTAADRAWQLPLWDDYQEQLKSNFADMANIGGRPGGSITAACFLSRFAGKFAWAHLDIAGTAWKSGGEKGATGRPVALLTHYLLTQAGQLR